MFSLDFSVCQFCACLFASVFTCVHLLTYPRAVVWPLCVSLSVCECLCMSVCVPACACVCGCACLFIWLSSSVFSVASPYLPCSLPSFHSTLPSSPHVAPSPVGVDTERPKSALLTPHCCDHSAQTLEVTLETHPSLHHFDHKYKIICNKMYEINIQSWTLLQHWLPDRKD